jgi:hypothetical protein
MLALLVTLQWAVSSVIPDPLTKQLITGSVVNLILAVSVLVGGSWCGVTVALISPLFAFWVGVIPGMQLPVLPAICVGNLVYVLLLHFLVGKSLRKKSVWGAAASAGGLVVAAGAKFGVLYLLVHKLIASLWANNSGWGLINAKGAAQATIPPTILEAMFWPQAVTALIGGILALLIVPLLWKALKRR